MHKAVPRFGNIGVFNRSHYEAVLPERVLKVAIVVIGVALTVGLFLRG